MQPGKLEVPQINSDSPLFAVLEFSTNQTKLLSHRRNLSTASEIHSLHEKNGVEYILVSFHLPTFEYSWTFTADSLTVEYRVGFVSEFYPNQGLMR